MAATLNQLTKYFSWMSVLWARQPATWTAFTHGTKSTKTTTTQLPQRLKIRILREWQVRRSWKSA